MFKKMLLGALDRRLNEAVDAGVMTPNDRQSVRYQAASLDWRKLIELILLIAELIMDFLASQTREDGLG